MKVTTICSGKVEEWNSTEDAMKDFFWAALSCDPSSSEASRYFQICADLEMGSPVAWDGIRFPGLEDLIAKRNEFVLNAMEECE